MSRKQPGRPRKRAALRVVPPPRRPRRRIPFLIVSAVLVGPLVFGVVTVQALVSQSSFRMQKLARENAQLQQSYGELKLEVAELSSPGRIAREARRLGLRLPPSSEVHTLDVPGPVAGNSSEGSGDPLSFSLKRLLGDQP